MPNRRSPRLRRATERADASATWPRVYRGFPHAAVAGCLANTRRAAAREVSETDEECKMKNLSPDDRPREKLRHHGAASLGDNELIALVIGSGSRRGNALSVANALLAAHGGLHQLMRCTLDDFSRTAGIGAARASQLMAALELGRRTLAHAPS